MDEHNDSGHGANNTRDSSERSQREVISNPLQRAPNQQTTAADEQKISHHTKPILGIRLWRTLVRPRKWRNVSHVNWVEKATLIVAILVLGVTTKQALIYSRQADLMEASVGQNERAVVLNQGQLHGMIESNRINREAMEVVQGAVISFSPGVKATEVFSPTDSGKVVDWQLSVPFSNDGNTATKNGQVNWSGRTMKKTIPDNYAFPDVDPEAGPFALGPKQSVQTRPLLVPVGAIQNVLERREHLYLYGWATYRDRFTWTPNRRTEFCYEMVRVSSLPLMEKIPVTDIEFVLCKHHNCYDDECEASK
jgi:hypothetical protein